LLLRKACNTPLSDIVIGLARKFSGDFVAGDSLGENSPTSYQIHFHWTIRMKKTFCLFLLFCTAAVCMAAEPSFRNLPRSTPEKQGVPSSAILDFIEAADQQIDTMNSFMLVRHGHVVAEGWWSPYDAKSPHMLYSLSKSFTSTAVGLAISDGKLSLDDEVLKFFPEDAPPEPSVNLKAMRVRDLLSMSAGHQTEVQLGATTPWTKSFLAHPVPHKPGTHFLYNTPATYMLSAIVQKVTGMTVLDYLRPRLFEPLGIENPTWDMSPQGISLGGYGLSVCTEDIARFGQLYLQKGNWNGRQLVPASWITAATTRQTSNGSDPKSDWDQGYGYQFWRCRHNIYRGDGAFGQFCIVMPEQDAVVAITSGGRNMQAVMNLVWEKLLPAMKEAPLVANVAASEKLTRRLAGLTVRPVTGHQTSSLASAVSGKNYVFPHNDQQLESVAFQFKTDAATLILRTSSGENQIVCPSSGWQKGKTSFTSGLAGNASAPAGLPIAANGAWTDDNTYTVKICLYETPFYITYNFHFNGDQLLFDGEFNVAFGPTKLPQLTGRIMSR
jgi:CubicO group peptidase (beta-lactamase class C family)